MYWYWYVVPMHAMVRSAATNREPDRESPSSARPDGTLGLAEPLVGPQTPASPRRAWSEIQASRGPTEGSRLRGTVIRTLEGLRGCGAPYGAPYHTYSLVVMTVLLLLLA